MKMPLLTAAREKVIAEIVDIPIEKVIPNPNQPRKKFYPDDINSLAESIRQNGIIQPLSVRKHDDLYELVAGERRLRAAMVCGLEYVPCIIMEISDCESAVMSLVENIQRKNLDCFDEAEAIRQMIDIYGLTQEEAAARLGKNQSTVANKLRLLKLSEDERRLICEYELTERHARALLKINDAEVRTDIIEQIHRKKLNVEKTERLIDSILEKQKKNSKLKRRSGLFRHMSLFANSINRAVDIMKASGVECETKRINGDGFVEFVVKIPTDKMFD